MRWASATHAALLYALIPTFIILIAAACGTRPSLRQAGGIVLAFAGALTLLLQRGLHFGPNSLTGDLLILGAAVAWAFYLYLGRDLTRRYGPILVTAETLIAGTQRPTRAELVRPPVRPPGMESSASCHSRAT